MPAAFVGSRSQAPFDHRRRGRGCRRLLSAYAQESIGKSTTCIIRLALPHRTQFTLTRTIPARPFTPKRRGSAIDRVAVSGTSCIGASGRHDLRDGIHAGAQAALGHLGGRSWAIAATGGKGEPDEMSMFDRH